MVYVPAMIHSAVPAAVLSVILAFPLLTPVENWKERGEIQDFGFCFFKIWNCCKACNLLIESVESVQY